MSKIPNPYKTLNVDKNASKEDIKKAYHRQAKKKHPDIGGNKEEFEELNMAYMILYDDAKRDHYDRTGEAEDQHSPNSQALELIYSIIDELLNQDCPLNIDLISIIKQNVTKVIQHQKTEVAMKKKSISKLNKIKKRLKRKNGDPIIEHMLENRLRKFQAEEQRELRKQESAILAMTILKEYSFEPEGTEWIKDRLMNTAMNTATWGIRNDGA